MKAHKGELLTILRRDLDVRMVEPTDATAVWRAAVGRLEGNPLFPSEVMEALWAADVQWAREELPDTAKDFDVERLDADGWPEGCIDPDKLTPCPTCGSLELWQAVAGDLFAQTPGRWYCLKCDPPTTARRLRARVARIRRKE